MKPKYIIVISKDATPKHYLPTYGNTYWKTPNIDLVAKNGVVFNNFYTCASSTAMSFYGMITGQYSYETNRKNYSDEIPFDGVDIFKKLSMEENGGFKSYFLWNKPYISFLKGHLKVLTDSDATIIPMNLVSEDIPPEMVTNELINPFSKDYSRVLSDISNEFEKIVKTNCNSFVWLHLPHVIYSRWSLGSDIDIYDKIVGLGIKFFGLDSIFLLSDHGSMDGKRGIFRYGFDVDQNVINIPLICPNIGNLYEHRNDFISNTQLFEIVTGRVKKRDFCICDTAYYEQRLRSFAIIHNGYKLVYIKEKDIFYLFDILFDPSEHYNLLSDNYFDYPRRCHYSSKSSYFYPYWEKAEQEKKILFSEFNRIYRKGSNSKEKMNIVKNKIVSFSCKFKSKHVKKIYYC